MQDDDGGRGTEPAQRGGDRSKSGADQVGPLTAWDCNRLLPGTHATPLLQYFSSIIDPSLTLLSLLCRSAEAKQTFQQIRCTLEVELARAKESLATPLLSNLKKEWIEQPGSIQVGVGEEHLCTCYSLASNMQQYLYTPA